MEQISNWKARQSGGRITITGISVQSGRHVNITGIDTIEPQYAEEKKRVGLMGWEITKTMCVIAIHKDGAAFGLV